MSRVENSSKEVVNQCLEFTRKDVVNQFLEFTRKDVLNQCLEFTRKDIVNQCLEIAWFEVQQETDVLTAPEERRSKRPRVAV